MSATDTDVRMELEAQYKTVTVKKEQLKDAAGPAGYAGAAAARPSWGGGRTPMHPGATPLHPSATPLHPSATPMHPGELVCRLLAFVVCVGIDVILTACFQFML